MKKSTVCYAIFMLLLTLAGCGKQDDINAPSNDAEQPEGNQVSANETESPFVPVSSDFHQIMLSFPLQYYECLEMDQNWIYFGRIPSNGQMPASGIHIYRNALFDTYNPESYITISKPFSLLTFLVNGGDSFIYGQYTDNEETELFILEKYDDTGVLLWRRDYTNEDLGDMGARLKSESITSDGRIFLHTYGEKGGIVSFDQNGDIEGFYTPHLTLLQGMAAAGDGTVYVYGTASANLVFEEVGGEGEQFISPLVFQQTFSGEGNHILLCSEKGVWEYAPGESDASLLWNWNDEYVQIAGSKIEKICYSEDTYYVMDSINHSTLLWQFGQPLNIVSISFRDRQEYPGKTPVTLARSYIADNDSWMEELVRLYNRQSKEYTIELVSYQTGTSYLNSLNILEQDLLRGQGPDLIELSNIYALNWAKKGILEDLGEYYESSSVIKQEDLLPPVQRACTLDGKNVLVIPFFYIRTWCSKEAVPMAEWTVWKYLEMSQEYQMFPLSDPYSAFIKCTTLDVLNRFVDYDAGECHFDSPEFAELLQECAKVPSKEVPRITWTGEFLDADYLTMDEWKVGSMGEYIAIESWYGDDVAYQGMPGWEGAKHALYAYDVFAMNSSSENKKGAWDFMEFLLSKEVQNIMDRGFPARTDNLEYYLKNSYNADSFSNPQPEEEDFQTMRDIISASVYTSTMSQGDTVRKVVKEEVSMYFAGSASLQQTIEKIQNRLSVYLAE